MDSGRCVTLSRISSEPFDTKQFDIPTIRTTGTLFSMLYFQVVTLALSLLWSTACSIWPPSFFATPPPLTHLSVSINGEDSNRLPSCYHHLLIHIRPLPNVFIQQKSISHAVQSIPSTLVSPIIVKCFAECLTTLGRALVTIVKGQRHGKSPLPTPKACHAVAEPL